MGFDNQRIEYLIIGGGVAGLAAANQLVDLGKTPLLIDSGHYPSNKVCGEFFSFECHSILKKWGVLPSQVIQKIKFFVGSETFEFELPEPARSGSRYFFDKKLYDRAIKKGARILVDTSVLKINYCPSSNYPFTVHLTRGNSFLTKNLFIGTGRVLSLLSDKKKKPCLPYLGIKAHLKRKESAHVLEMHLVPQGYVGMSPIGEGLVNVACLVEKNAVDQAGSPSNYLAKVFPEISKVEWIATDAPEFCFHDNFLPYFKNLYLIGDAAASIAPISGDGLAMAITSAVLAAHCAIDENNKEYIKKWRRLYRSRLRWAKGLHVLLLHPKLAKMGFKLCLWIPGLFNWFFKKTRGKCRLEKKI